MTRNSLIQGLFWGAVILAAAPMGAKAAAFSLGSDSGLWLEGDSTLHPYTSKTVDLKLINEVDSASLDGSPAFWDAVLHKSALKQLRLTLPVKSLKSKESALDKNMYKALQANTYPDIVFDLSSYEVRPSTTSEERAQVTAAGTLTVAGQTRPIVLIIDATSQGTDLRLQGHYTLQMTQFGITPPSLMFGAIKVKDRIDIYFDLRGQAVKS